MPIKVRCKECRTVMTVPDKAAGRAVKCKECGGRVPVRAADSKPRKRKPRPRPEPAFSDPDDPDDLFSSIDLRRAEDRKEKLCPSCASVVDPELDIECPACGVNIDTGVLSQKQKTKRARKGPPPEKFYKAIWSDAWGFTTDHWNFVFRTGFTWGIAATMMIIAVFIINWYIPGRAAELRDSASPRVQFTEEGTLIEFGPDAKKAEQIKYDGVMYKPGSTLLTDRKLLLPTPENAAMMAPPSMFWSFIFLVYGLSLGGWAWVLSGIIVKMTMAKEKKIKRFTPDGYANMTRGFTTVFWPIVLMFPFMPIPLVMFLLGVNSQACFFTFLALFFIPYVLFLPIAVVHMSQPYTYRAWLLNWTLKDFVNVIAPALYVSLLFFVLVLMVPAIAAIAVITGWEQFSDFYTNIVELQTLSALMEYTPQKANSMMTFSLFRLPLLLMIALTGNTIVCTLMAIPSIFMMRVFGLFGLYFRPDMDLCVEQIPLSSAGFGPRFLAMQVDLVICGAITGVCLLLATMVRALVVLITASAQVGQGAFWIAALSTTFFAIMFYFTKWESGGGRATLGKWSFGLVVVQNDNTPISPKIATQRFLLSLLAVVTASGTFIMCAFHPNFSALHDIASKSKVVWRGDEDQ